jgi:multidrug resistance efflux pump
MEPRLEDIEDYNDKESSEKRKTVKIVIMLLLMCGIFYAVVKNYYDSHMPESFNPVVTKDIVDTTKSIDR